MNTEPLRVFLESHGRPEVATAARSQYDEVVLVGTLAHAVAWRGGTAIEEEELARLCRTGLRLLYEGSEDEFRFFVGGLLAMVLAERPTSGSTSMMQRAVDAARSEGRLAFVRGVLRFGVFEGLSEYLH